MAPPLLVDILDVEALPLLLLVGGSDRERSEKPESCDWWSRSEDLSEEPLCRSFLLTTSKKDTGTRPRALGISGLQASYQSGSSSRLITWKKSPLLKASS